MTTNRRKAIQSQGVYAETRARDRSLNLFVPEAFVRGIRHIGYKSNVEAIAEIIDNSIQAYAERVDILFDFPRGGSAAKPIQLAIVDDGHGMGPAMLRFAMMWGGTHRENDRGGLGRFGYGLPCATVSMGRRFSIYSKVSRGRIHAVTLDLDLLDSGAYRNSEAELEIPAAYPAELPDFVRIALKRLYPGGWKSGTVVIIDKLDRLDWTTAAGLRRNLVRHFGVAYHKLLAETAIHVDGERVRSVDPLFLSPHGELHALDEDRAHALDAVTFEVKTDSGEASGEITLRYAWLPPTFGAIDKSRDAIGINANARFPILKQYHGIVFSRNGRIVDVLGRTPWTTFINNDRYIRIEVEFSAYLDEAFGVTTSKQQVSVTPEMWNRLREAGLAKAIEHLRGKVRTAKASRQERHSPHSSYTRDASGTPPASGFSARKVMLTRPCKDAALPDVVRRIGTETALQILLTQIRKTIDAARPKEGMRLKDMLEDWLKDLNACQSP